MVQTAKTHVFIISGKSPVGDSGGYPAYAYNLAHVLSSLDYKVSIFAIREKQSIKKTPYGTIHFASTKLIHFFPMLKHLALAGLPYYSIILYKTMKDALRVSKADHCIVWGMGPWGFPGALLKLFPPAHVRVRLITSYFTSTRHEMRGGFQAIRIRDYGIMPKIKYFFVYHIVAVMFHFFELLTLRACERIVVHYKSSARIIKNYFYVSSQKIIRFPWYVDIFQREGISNMKHRSFRHPLIVSICRQDPRKGINFIIRAMSEVIKTFPEAQLLIVGSGEFLNRNKKLVAHLGLKRHISVTGFVSDIRPILKEADIAVIVPVAQGSSALTVLEAMSYGKAIIGSNCDGIPEDITHNVSGLIVPPGNIKSLSRAMIQLIKNSRLRKKLGTGALKAYKKRFGFTKLREDVRQSIQSLLP